MKLEKGFTLIELLAVIVILAVIALIATPLTINVINSSKEKAFINTAYGVIDAVRLLSAQEEFNNESKELVIHFSDGMASSDEFKISGGMPDSGTVHINSKGQIELKLWSEKIKKCVEKGFDDSNVYFTESRFDECSIDVKISTGKSFKEIMSVSSDVKYDPYNNLRYVGSNPENYVTFNGELWRIIGLFDGQPKIVSTKYYGNDDYFEIVWDYNYTNNWEVSTLGVELNNKIDGYITTIEKNFPESYGYIDIDHVWNVGGIDDYESATRSDFYTAERSESISDTMTNHLWTGAIGLMYPSDYGYSTSASDVECDTVEMYNWDGSGNVENCRNNSWLFDNQWWQWTLTPYTGGADSIIFIDTSGYVGESLTEDYNTARLVLYLNPDVKIVDGKGTDQEPYILGY